jgi:hypothetical protein
MFSAKRLLSLLLGIGMMIGSLPIAFATPPTPPPTNVGEIKITGIRPDASGSFSNSITYNPGYVFKDEFKKPGYQSADPMDVVLINLSTKNIGTTDVTTYNPGQNSGFWYGRVICDYYQQNSNFIISQGGVIDYSRHGSSFDALAAGATSEAVAVIDVTKFEKNANQSTKCSLQNYSSNLISPYPTFTLQIINFDLEINQGVLRISNFLESTGNGASTTPYFTAPSSAFLTSIGIPSRPTTTVPPTQFFSANCYLYGFYGIDDYYIVQVQDRLTTTLTKGCNATDWKVKYPYGNNDAIGTTSQNAEMIKFLRHRGGTIIVEAIRGNESVSQTFEIASGNKYQPPNNSQVSVQISSEKLQNGAVQLQVGEQARLLVNITKPEGYTLFNQSWQIDVGSNGKTIVDCFEQQSAAIYRICVGVTPGVTNVTYTTSLMKVVNGLTINLQGTASVKVNVTAKTPVPPLTPTNYTDYEDEVRTTFTSNPFSDTNINTLEGKAAAELNRRKIIGGFANKTFRGKQGVDRAAAAKFLLLARGVPVPERVTSSKFSDVLTGEWYARFTETAAIYKIIIGFSDGTFRPGDGVLTSEFIKMMAITFNLETDLPYTYSDANNYPGAWFWKYAGAVQKYDLFPNRKPNLMPERGLTRNEVAVAIYQYLKNRGTTAGSTGSSSSRDSISAFYQEKFGYKFLYPAPYVIASNTQDNLSQGVLHSMRIKNPESKKGSASFELGVYQTATNNPAPGQAFIGTKTIGGEQASVYEDTQPACTYDNCLPSRRSYFFSHNNQNFHIGFDLFPENQSVYASILESFSFTN